MSEPLLSWLYVPGDRPERFDKAVAAGPSAVVVDLEDAVDPATKAGARDHVRDWLAAPRTSGPERHVRINGLRTPFADDDLAAVAGLPGLDAVRVPKVESADDVARVADAVGPHVGLYCLLESARGLREVESIAGHPRTTGIALGEQDLAADLGVTDPGAIRQVRFTAVLAAAAAGLPPVPMSVHPRIDDDAGFLAGCREGRALGMLGRSAIHPRQVPLVAHGFAPDDDEVAWAHRVTDAARAAGGTGASVTTHGEFVDAPILTRAEALLRLAALAGR